MLARGAVRTVSLFMVAALVLCACNTDDDASDDPTTGSEAAFEITGDVSAVDVEDVDVGIDLSTGPDGVEFDPSASATVQLTVNLESINQEAAGLCKLEVGSDAILTVTDETDLELDRPFEELGTIGDESVKATGRASELSAETASPNAATDPDGACRLQAETLSLAEETASPSATP
jgi:hypothetical protein